MQFKNPSVISSTEIACDDILSEIVPEGVLPVTPIAPSSEAGPSTDRDDTDRSTTAYCKLCLKIDSRNNLTTMTRKVCSTLDNSFKISSQAVSVDEITDGVLNC